MTLPEIDMSVPAALRAPGRRLGYARVSTNEQNPEAQSVRLIADGCAPEHIWTDKGASGSKASRPRWDVLLRELRPGDTLVIVKLDRVGRSVKNLVEIAAWLDEHAITFRVLGQAIDTSTPSGRLMFHVLAAIAEFERDLIIERTLDGLAVVRQSGNLRRSTGGAAPLGLRDPGPADDDRRDWITDPEPAAMLARVAALVIPPNPEPLAAAFAAERATWAEPMLDSHGTEINEKMVRMALRRPLSAGLLGADDVEPALDSPPLDVATWRSLCALFASRVRPGRVTSDDDPYWAGPLLRCDVCGNQMSGTKRKPRTRKGVVVPGRESVSLYRCANARRIGTRDGKPVYNQPCRRVSIQAEQVNEAIREAVETWRDSSPHHALAARRQQGVATERARLMGELDDWQGMMDDLLPTQPYTSRTAFAAARDSIAASITRTAAQLSALDDDGAPVTSLRLDWQAMPGAARRRFAAEVIVTPITIKAGRGGARPIPASERIELLPYAEAATP